MNWIAGIAKIDGIAKTAKTERLSIDETVWVYAHEGMDWFGNLAGGNDGKRQDATRAEC